MRVVTLDTEHSDNVFNPWEPEFYLTCTGVIVWEDGEIITKEVVWFEHHNRAPDVDGIAKVQKYINQADLLVFHNAKHDINVLSAFDIEFNSTPLWCTMLVEYLLNGQVKKSYSLGAVAESYRLGDKIDEVKKMWDQGISTYDIPEHILATYCLKDVQLTLDIYLRQKPAVDSMGLNKVVDLQNEFTYVLSEMEINGLRFDMDVAKQIAEGHEPKLEKLRQAILKDVEKGEHFNLSSPQHLSVLLFGGILKYKDLEWVIRTYKTKPYSDYYEALKDKEYQHPGLGFQPKANSKKADGYYKVDKDTIAGLPAPTADHRRVKKLLIEYSKHAKVISSLVGRKGDKGLVAKVQRNNLLHPTLNQIVAATGRLTSSNPNGQNLPRGSTSPIKLCFTPRHDYIMQVDLSQIEWRTAAWLSQDPQMIKEINNDVDQHVATVKDLMEMEFISKDHSKSKENRNKAKVFNFRMIYGGTEWGFYLDIDMPNFSLKKWRKIIADFFKKYAGLKHFHDTCIKTVDKTGQLVLPTGRWFKFVKTKQKDGSFWYSPNQVKNYPTQGMAGGDILPLLAVIIRRGMKKMGLKSLMILTVHDSIVFDVVKEEKDRLAKLCYAVGNNLDKYIKNYYKLGWNVKLECEVECGDNYKDMKLVPNK